MPDLVMNELSPGSEGFSGQLGFIEFTSDIRLPRHIHMNVDRTRLIDERILVLHGVGLVEIAGKIWTVAPGSLAELAGGVPHTWTACPAGVSEENKPR
jgi:quercetin dioxygenase-like cupin family protein